MFTGTAQSQNDNYIYINNITNLMSLNPMATLHSLKLLTWVVQIQKVFEVYALIVLSLKELYESL